MKTKQIGSEKPPENENDTLALIIRCPECDTQRAFRINDTVALVITRKSSGAKYETWCEICGHRITFQIAWTKRHPGWVAERLSLTDYVTVEDSNGMSKTKGGKLI
jgi:DNA-directed RNA polymerase subunit RPC12/RpoP